MDGAMRSAECRVQKTSGLVHIHDNITTKQDNIRRTQQTTTRPPVYIGYYTKHLSSQSNTIYPRHRRDINNQAPHGALHRAATTRGSPHYHGFPPSHHPFYNTHHTSTPLTNSGTPYYYQSGSSSHSPPPTRTITIHRDPRRNVHHRVVDHNSPGLPAPS